MSLQLYNTASRRIETPELGKLVQLYVCGITPYESAHMGHVFTFLTYDILQRYLESEGREVRLVRNITDVDEPIYVRAKELGIAYTELAASETELFQTVMRQLNLRTPFAEPFASHYIEEMSGAVRSLLEANVAYKLDGGDVYFDTASDPTFGELSNFSEPLRLKFMADRGGDPERPGKHQPQDFLLWKAVSSPTDPAAWETPLGRGRPGWHIECTVMSSQLLQLPLDFHGGGMDLIFPHHECENAQSLALGQKPLAKHWLHVAPLGYHGEKMSKSLGNLVFAKDLLEHYSAGVIRLAMLQYHYRTGGEWHNDSLLRAEELATQLQGSIATDSGPSLEPFRERFLCALENDLDTPEMFATLCDYAKAASQDKQQQNGASDQLSKLLALIGIELL